MLIQDEILQVIRSIEIGIPLPLKSDRSTKQSDIFPQSPAIVITAPNQNTFIPQELIWGFNPESISRVIFNTRIENAATSPLWRESFARRRCIVPSLAFYEPHRSEVATSATGKPVKQIYRFVGKNNLPLLMAGIWQNNRFSVITAQPDTTVSPIHDRMPVIFTVQEAKSWLQGDSINSDFTSSLKLISQPVYPKILKPSQLPLF